MFEVWGIQLTPADAEYTRKTSKALELAAKQMIQKSISRSPKMIPEFRVKTVKSTVNVPNISSITNKNLAITSVQWHTWDTCWALGFTLNDGQTCKAGEVDFEHSHIFDPAKKIT